jgi:hypothetical protein
MSAPAKISVDPWHASYNTAVSDLRSAHGLLAAAEQENLRLRDDLARALEEVAVLRKDRDNWRIAHANVTRRFAAAVPAARITRPETDHG